MKLKHSLLISTRGGLRRLRGLVVFAQQSDAAGAADIPDAPQATAAATTVPNGPTVVMDTSMGRITCQFYQKQAPKAVANFIGLAEGTKDWTDPATEESQHHKPLLRRHHLPSRHSRVHDSGRRPHGHGHGRSRLQL